VCRLPVGRDGKFLNHMNSIGEAIMEGWQSNGICQYHSDEPFTPILA
jgi:hypothetical protein